MKKEKGMFKKGKKRKSVFDRWKGKTKIPVRSTEDEAFYHIYTADDIEEFRKKDTNEKLTDLEKRSTLRKRG